jgi:hypothetical protein
MGSDLRVAVLDDEADEERLDLLAGSLREELLDLDVLGVTRATAGQAPVGTRGGLAEAAGVLLVAIGPAMGSFSQVVEVVRAWIGRGHGSRTAVLEIDGDRLEVTGVGGEEQRRLIDAWISAVTSRRE